jgi:hypothetical protein
MHPKGGGLGLGFRQAGRQARKENQPVETYKLQKE